jgi:hypothetical protein
MGKNAQFFIRAVIVIGLAIIAGSYYLGMKTTGVDDKQIKAVETTPKPTPDTSIESSPSASVTATPSGIITINPKISIFLKIQSTPTPSPTLINIQISGIKKIIALPTSTPTPVKFIIVSPSKLQIKP